MSDDEPPRVELRVRDLTPTGVHDRRDAVYERLLQLREDGYIADVSVEVWGKQVSMTANSTSMPEDASISATRAIYEEFEAWAERNDRDLEPAFSTHQLGSSLIDDQDRTEAIRFPVLCLAVYDDDKLSAVVPCVTDEGVRTVDDCLAALQSEDSVPSGVKASD